jgi:transposase
MSYISGIARERLMLSGSIEEYVSADNIVRFIDAFVDWEIGSHSELLKKGKSETGRPSYTANCLCKLLIYGYFNSVSSSRKLECETSVNLEVIWLMRNLSPDHWTISDFRKENRLLISQITIDFRKFLKSAGYIKGKSISTDGTKIKANASRDVLTTGLTNRKLEKAEKEIERYFARLDSYYMGQIPILLRSKKKVQVEMDLYSTACNLRRLFNTDTVPLLLEKLAKWLPVPAFPCFLTALISFWASISVILTPIYRRQCLPPDFY